MSHILVIEDNHVNLEMITFLLKSFGHTTKTASDGAAGVKMAEVEDFDLIICDLQLPKLDGYGVVKLLKHNEALAHIPVIAVSSYAMVGDKEKAMAGGFDFYISKPIDPSSFVTEIERCIKAP